jgi:hypothetical protein
MILTWARPTNRYRRECSGLRNTQHMYQSRERVQQTDIDGRVDIQLDTCTRVERALQNRKAPGGCFAPSVVRLDGTPRIACAGCQFLLGLLDLCLGLSLSFRTCFRIHWKWILLFSARLPLKMNPTFESYFFLLMIQPQKNWISFGI